MSDNSEQEKTVTLDSDGNLILTHAMGASNAGREVRLKFELLPTESEFRGSRKHILDLLDSPQWAQTIQDIIDIDGILLADKPRPKPSGHLSVNETDLDNYIREYGDTQWANALQLDGGRWWAPNGGTRPQMDLICRIKVGGKDGLLFVEAKAHEGELDWGGKPLATDASDGTLGNHENICKQIAIANKGLNENCISGFNLTVNSHYQLVNRITYLWKLASLGIPVVLMYLGFRSDKYFSTDYLRDDLHWQRIMGGYLQGVAPHGFPENEFSTRDGTSLRMIIRSCDISNFRSSSQLPDR